ncbi:hypothetical protein GA0074692_0886 [Micromonospora pallida]|uniref:Uncharacterized protein n=1 Tax=Micromonospora pallida TaxID=145854 RepID=A0A1C6RTG8_9ACTN|nr:hypothetical protein [Micromonospora pallida]SCL20506.1 hypothetical protein GA0074692_0886 [Micromonospora pallida]
MNEHSTPQPAHQGGTPHIPSMDLVAGEPPVPITVWRTARSGDDQSTSISHRLAYRLVAAYSRSGEAVVDLTDTHVLDTACLRGRRRHHPAWFTGASAPFVGPQTPQHLSEPDDGPDSDGPDSDGPDSDGPDSDGPDSDGPDVRAWFGDDLTDPDPDWVAGDEPSGVPGDGDDLQGRTSLVVATWPLDASSDAANHARLAWLLAACGRLLRPGGCLVLVVGVPAGAVATPEDFTPVVDAAAGSGLGYLQHIVAVAADTDGDRFTYHATDEELLSLARTTSAEQFVLHVKVHADLLVFTSRQGGDRRA